MLVDTRSVVGRIAPEGNVKILQESVATSEQRLGLVGVRVDTRLAIEDNDSISQVGSHDEIVLDDEGSLLGVHDISLDDTRSNNTLLGVKIGRRLVDEVDISGHTKGKNDSNTLQFTTGQVLNFLVNKVIELQGLDDIGLELRGQEGGSDLLEEELADGALELRSNSLRLHADPHLRDGGLAIGLQRTSQKSAEGRLSSTVLTHHDNDFGISELAGINAKLEVA